MAFQKIVVEFRGELYRIRRVGTINALQLLQRNNLVDERSLLLGDIPVVNNRFCNLLQRQRNAFRKMSRRNGKRVKSNRLNDEQPHEGSEPENRRPLTNLRAKQKRNEHRYNYNNKAVTSQSENRRGKQHEPKTEWFLAQPQPLRRNQIKQAQAEAQHRPRKQHVLP